MARRVMQAADDEALLGQMEAALLGALLVDPGQIEGVLEVLEGKHFSTAGHGAIFAAIADLHQEQMAVDKVTVAIRLQERGEIVRAGGAVYLSNLEAPFAAHALDYAQKIRAKAQVRELAAVGHNVVELCARANGNVADVMLHAESMVVEVTNKPEHQKSRVITAEDLLAMDLSRQSFVINNGILPAGGGLIIAGESGEGKSLLRLELAIHLAWGRDCWILDIAKPVRVLTLQFENTPRIEQIRLKCMLDGLPGAPREQILQNLFFPDPVPRLNLSEKKDQVAVANLIRRCGAEVIIYDPLTSLHRINENDNVQMRALLDNITEINRQTGAASMLVHHYGKPDKEGSLALHRTRGASSIRDWCDTLIGITRKKGDKILRTLEFLKVRCGPEPQPITLERDKESFLHSVIDDESLCPPAKVRAILEGLGGRVDDQKTLVAAIIQETGCKERRARHFLQQAINQGAIFSQEDPKEKRRNNYWTGTS